jgi:hypothetical protein
LGFVQSNEKKIQKRPLCFVLEQYGLAEGGHFWHFCFFALFCVSEKTLLLLHNKLLEFSIDGNLAFGVSFQVINVWLKNG